MNSKERLPLQIGVALITVASIFFTTIMSAAFATHMEIRVILLILLIVFLLPMLSAGLLIAKYVKNQQLARKKRLLRTIIWKGHLTDLARISDNMGITIEETAALAEAVAKEDMPTAKKMKIHSDDGYIEIDRPWAKARLYHCPDCDVKTWINIGLDLTCPYCGSAIR